MSVAREPFSRRLARGRRLARLALGWEALWPRLWPVLGVAGLFVALALSGLFLHLPGWLHALLLLGFALALGAAIWRAARGFALPRNAEADRRLERESGLSHRPLSTLTDRPATQDDPMAAALWQVHQARAAAALERLRVGTPRPGLAARDRRALRMGLVVALVAALGIAGGEAPERLRRALQPALGGVGTPIPGLRLEAWISPPAYTGAAPLFLPLSGGALNVPAGSRLQVSLSGGQGGVPELQLGEATTPFRALDATSFTVEAPLETAARIVVRRDGRELAQWTLSTQADAPPTIAFAEPPAAASRGLAIRLPWRAEDDWGVTAAQAEIHLSVRPDAPPLVLDLPISGQARQPRGVAQPDLSAHPWAGLPVRIRLLARDAAGQEGRSEEVELELPERNFTHPVARQLAALRKSLSLDPLARGGVQRGLDELSLSPDAFDNDITTFLALRSARYRLTHDQQPEAVPSAQELMWQIAIALEEGRTDRTARALAEARQALREAMAEAERNPQDAERRAELERRVQELREAIARHLQALAEQLQRENGETPTPDAEARMIDPQELDRRTQEMRDAAREGRTQDMQQQLAELEQMLEDLQNGQMARQEGGQNRQQQQRQQRGQQQMGAIQDMVRREGEMLDRSHQRDQAETAEQQQQSRRAPRRQPPQEGQSAEQRAQEAQGDARQQRALRRALGELMQQFGDLTGEVPEALGRADQAMRQAQEALGQGGDATPHQQQAIRELQEGAQQMAQTMQRQFGQGQQGQEEGEGQGEARQGQGRDPNGPGRDQARGQREGRDPLGRPTRNEPNANDQGSDTVVPGEAEALRTRQLQEELRRRGAERERPPSELDYIERLLKTF